MKQLLSICLLAQLAVSPASAEFSVQDLILGCEAAASGEVPDDTRDGLMATYCLGLVYGVSTVTSFNCSSRAEGSNPYVGLVSSFPPSNAAGARAFVNWANDNPANWGDPASTGMLLAVATNFPCQISPMGDE